jgi:hypothetical protein
MPTKLQKRPSGPITPLWIIATFVTFTETVLGYAVTKVAGGVQITLTIFVMLFAVAVAGAFFAILWNRPYVFYAPSEYGSVDPQKFIHAMKGVVPEKLLEGVEHVEANPQSDEAKFELVDGLVERASKQHLIAMKLSDSTVPIAFFGGRYLTGDTQHWSAEGGFQGEKIWSDFQGTGFLEIVDEGPAVRLTYLGKLFVEWLEKTNRKAQFYESPIAKWGQPWRPDGVPPFSPFINRPSAKPQVASQPQPPESMGNPITVPAS